MNRLLLLTEDLVQQASSTTVKPAVPIKPAEQLPVKPIAAWTAADGALKKTFKFKDSDTRTSFLYQLLSYEQEKGHNAELVVRAKSVAVVVSTHELKSITELDREYTRAADVIYREVQDLAAR